MKKITYFYALLFAMLIGGGWTNYAWGATVYCYYTVKVQAVCEEGAVGYVNVKTGKQTNTTTASTLETNWNDCKNATATLDGKRSTTTTDLSVTFYAKAGSGSEFEGWYIDEETNTEASVNGNAFPYISEKADITKISAGSAMKFKHAKYYTEGGVGSSENNRATIVIYAKFVKEASGYKYKPQLTISSSNFEQGQVSISMKDPNPTSWKYQNYTSTSETPPSVTEETSTTQTFYVNALAFRGYKFNGWTKSQGSIATSDDTNADSKVSTSYKITLNNEMTPNAEGIITNNDVITASFVTDSKLSYKIQKEANVGLVWDAYLYWSAKKAGNNTVTGYDSHRWPDFGKNDTLLSAVTEKTFTDMYASDKITLTAVPDEGYVFSGWYVRRDMKQDSLMTTNQQLETTLFEDNLTFVPVFAPDKDNMAVDEHDHFLVGQSLCQTFEQALAAATQGQHKTILQLKDYTISAGNYTIPAGVTLLVPYGADQLTASPALRRTESSDVPNGAYCTLTLESGAHLDVFGIIEVGGQQSIGALDDGGETGIGVPGGETYGEIYMESNSSITLNNGSHLYAWGYILGDRNTQGYTCEIDVRRGAAVHEQFQVMDWKGGNNTYYMFYGNNSSKNGFRVLPINQYYVQNIEVPTKYRPGSKLGAALGVNLKLNVGGFDINTKVNLDDAGIVGSYRSANDYDAAIFLMNEQDDSEDTWVRKYYDEVNDRQVYEVNNAAYLGGLVLNIFGKSADSREYKLPVTNNFRIHLLYGQMQITQTTELLPGAEIEVNKKATLTIQQDSTIYLWDSDDWGKYVNKTKGDGRDYTFGYASHVKSIPAIPQRGRAAGEPTIRDISSPNKLGDAKLIVHGTVDVQGYIKSTSGGATVVSTVEDAGTIQFTKAAPSDAAAGKIYQLISTTSLPNKSAYEYKQCISAKLTNGDGTLQLTAETEANKSYCFIDMDEDGDGEWVSLTTDGCFVSDGSTYYVKPKEYVALASNEEDETTHLYYSQDRTRSFILLGECQWWEVTQVGDNLFKCEHPNNTTYYYYDELAEEWLEKKFKVTWLNWDGKPIKYYSALAGDSVNYYYVTYNTVPDWKGSTPTHKTDSSHTYSFSGWLPTPAPVTEDVTYVAQFAERDRMYAITFNDKNDELIQLVYCKLGEVPVCSKHELAANEQWSPAVGAVAGDQTYKLADKKNAGPFTIKFVNWDGKELQSASVAKDGAVAYTGATPTKKDDDLHSYNFTGWTPAVTPATADATYTATYTTAPRSNDIVLDANGSQNLNDVATLKDNLIITSDGSSSGQLLGASKLTLKGDAVFKLATTIPARTWYAVAAPWKVDVRTGIYANGNRLTVGRDFDIIEFDAEAYASEDSGEKNRNIWKYVEENGGVMIPGKLYMIYLASEKSSLEFHRTTGSTIFTTTVSLSTTGGSGDKANWNAIANPALYHANLGISVIEDNSNDVLQYTNGGYTPATASNMIVGKPIFVQVNNSQSTVIAAVAGSAGMPAYRRAPQTATDNRFVVEITRDGQMNDRIIVQTAEEKADEYVIGKDLAKIGVGTKAAQMWMERYNTQLCKNTLELTDEQADYPLSLFTPAAGEYVLSAAQERGEATLYLTRNGQPVWNLSYGEYVLNLEKGTTTEYGLRLVGSNAPQITTGIGNVQSEDVQCTKVLRDGVIYILRGNNTYSIDGQLIK